LKAQTLSPGTIVSREHAFVSEAHEVEQSALPAQSQSPPAERRSQRKSRRGDRRLSCLGIEATLNAESAIDIRAQAVSPRASRGVQQEKPRAKGVEPDEASPYFGIGANSA
jgi:hypothetical protein